MALKYRFNLKDIKLEDFKVYLLAMFKGILPKKKIKNFLDLEQFIQKKSAWVTQVTLYNYLKTRMGTKYVLHFDNDVFIDSINLAKWNIYIVSLQDLTFYTFSYIYNSFNLNDFEYFFNKPISFLLRGFKTISPLKISTNFLIVLELKLLR